MKMFLLSTHRGVCHVNANAAHAAQKVVQRPNGTKRAVLIGAPVRG